MNNVNVNVSATTRIHFKIFPVAQQCLATAQNSGKIWILEIYA